MMTTPDLFTYRPSAHSHREDPDSAWEAAVAAKSFANNQAQRVLARLRVVGDATATELASVMDGLDLYAVRRRLSDLKAAGKVAETGSFGLTESGRRETIYRPA